MNAAVWDEEKRDLFYSYFCPMTEQRVVSSRAYYVEWCDAELEKNTEEMKDDKFPLHRILLIAQMVPHIRSWPDRHIMCNLRMVARDHRARCHYDSSGARSPGIGFMQEYQSDYEKPDPDGEPMNKKVVQMRKAFRWDNSRVRILSLIHI